MKYLLKHFIGLFILTGQFLYKSGDAEKDRFGRAVSISGDGKTVAGGAYLNRGNEKYSDQAKVFSF